MDNDGLEPVWKHSWPSTTVLCEYLAKHKSLFKNATVLELGAGAACLQSLLALKLGAKQVYITDRQQALDLIRKNVNYNFPGAIEDGRVHVLELDWTSNVETLLTQIPTLDLVLGSDIFFDPSVFRPVIETLWTIINHSPRSLFYFAYQVRSNWSIECLLHEYNLKAELVCTIDSEQTIIIVKVTNKSMGSEKQSYFVGVEGGATRSKFLVINEAGQVLDVLTSTGLNCLLEGIEKSAEHVASNIKMLVSRAQVVLPVAALGLGLSGAENPIFNQRLINYIRAHYPELSENIYLNTDSIVSIAANFSLKTSATVLVAGTGSSARLLMPNGKVLSCGGWGHLLGDGGSGYWIAARCIQRLLEFYDGLLETPMSVEKVESAFLAHFQLKSRVEVLDIFYGSDFAKSKISSFCEPLAKLARDGDDFAQENFFAAGQTLARHLVALCKKANLFEDAECVQALAVGSVFESFDLLHDGFRQVIQEALIIKEVRLFKPTVSPAVGAAIMAAKSIDVSIEVEQNPLEIGVIAI